MGTVNFLRHLIPRCAEILAPLNLLCHKDKQFEWNDEHQAALNKIKTILTSDAALSTGSEPGQLVLRTDASCDLLSRNGYTDSTTPGINSINTHDPDQDIQAQIIQAQESAITHDPQWTKNLTKVKDLWVNADGLVIIPHTADTLKSAILREAHG